MPEFIMPGRDAPTFQQLSAFTRGYIEAMFFTSCSDPDDGDLQHATFGDLAPETLDKIRADCDAFERANAATLEQAYEQGGEYAPDYDAEAAGRDFWYTRNGHGVGFWDRGLGDLGDKLSDAARHRECWVYRGDDGKVYLE